MEKTEHDFYRRGSGEAGGLLGLVILGLIIWGIASLFGFNYHGTSEGTFSIMIAEKLYRYNPIVGTLISARSSAIMPRRKAGKSWAANAFASSMTVRYSQTAVPVRQRMSMKRQQPLFGKITHTPISATTICAIR